MERVIWSQSTDGKLRERASDPNETAFESFHVLFHHPGYAYDDEEVVYAIQETIEILSKTRMSIWMCLGKLMRQIAPLR